MVSVGESFSHYEVIAPIGRGGMGEVYLARDKNLDRKVALKFIALTSDENRDHSRRFTREAKAASTLNHPNILTIYEIGQFKGSRYIASEFIEGMSLRQLLRRYKQIDLEQTIDIGIQILSAVSSAHAAGIIHRDIKPENIMIRDDGVVKVLDFGLAKLVSPGSVGSESLTRELGETSPGMVLGTAQYMSPEQARGKKVDTRTDIWSIGVVLYEMLAGRPPFEGETATDLLAAILKNEPEPLAERRPDVTHDLELAVRKALVKDPEERYQVAKDFLLDMKLVRGFVSSAGPETASAAGMRQTLESSRRTTAAVALSGKRVWLAAGLVLIALGAGAYVWFGGRTAGGPGPPLTSTQVASWKSELTDNDASRARLSPDGRMVAFVASRAGKKTIWLSQVSGGEPFAREQNDEFEETSPLWSPDGESIAFLSDRDGQRGIWRMPAFGGPSVLVAPIESRSHGLVHWSKDAARIYFEMKQNLYSLDVSTRAIVKVTDFDEAVFISRGFAFSPDEKRIAFADRRDGRMDIWIAAPDGSNASRAVDDPANDSNPIWHPDGKRIIYNSDRDGVQQVFAVEIGRGQPVQLTFSDTDSRVSDISADGSRILYATRKDDSDIWGVSVETGRETQKTSDVGLEFWPDVSPADGSLAFQSVDRSSIGNRLLRSTLEVRRAADGRDIRISEEGFAMRFSPDGAFIAFLRRGEGGNSIWLASAAGGDAKAVTAPGVFFGGNTQLPFNRVQTRDLQWAPDSKSIVYCAVRDGLSNVYRTDLSANEIRMTDNGDPKLFFAGPVLSPDGARIAWVGRAAEDPAKPMWSIWTNTDAGPRQVYRSEADLALIGFLADGERVLVRILDRAGAAPSTPVDVRIAEIDLTAGRVRELNLLRNTYFYNIMPAPDRMTIAYVSRETGTDVLRVQRTGSPGSRILLTGTDPRVYFAGFAFAPDGKTLYFSRQANWQIISILNNFK
jgi:Tol biopolymer transport system component